MNYYDLAIPAGADYINAFAVTQNNQIVDLTGYSATLYVVNAPSGITPLEFSTFSGQITNGNANGILTLHLTPNDITMISGNMYKLEIDNTILQTEVYAGNIFIISEAKNNLEYLIPVLRMQLGDTDAATYRYLDEWLNIALISSIKILQRWWADRYLIDPFTNVVTRNPLSQFLYTEPNVIQSRDERPVILMASILVKGGQLEANSWNVGSWKDAEIAVSNIEGNRAKQFGIGLDWEELKMYILPPTKRLSSALRIAHPSDAE